MDLSTNCTPGVIEALLLLSADPNIVTDSEIVEVEIVLPRV